LLAGEDLRLEAIPKSDGGCFKSRENSSRSSRVSAKRASPERERKFESREIDVGWEEEMADINLIQEKVKLLPEPTQQQVLDFVDYLLQRSRHEDLLWSKLSLRWALRDLEDEEWPKYDGQDLKEKWA
jgi:hypothetical protein